MLVARKELLARNEGERCISPVAVVVQPASGVFCGACNHQCVIQLVHHRLKNEHVTPALFCASVLLDLNHLLELFNFRTAGSSVADGLIVHELGCAGHNPVLEHGDLLVRKTLFFSHLWPKFQDIQSLFDVVRHIRSTRAKYSLVKHFVGNIIRRTCQLAPCIGVPVGYSLCLKP